ncbi:MAG TPA: MDR family MFS transporter [Stellaceae bacterium]|nr:MDR family MFS transporter [Stellaceae bacterium]
MPDRSPLPLPPPISATRRRWILAATMMAMFMAAVESTIVSTAMPTIVAELGGFHLLSWVFAAYLLTQAVTIPIYGRLADLYGRKGMLLAGSGIFLAGSLLCGFARDMPSLILFRALQGLGAGAIMPVATTIIGDLYPPAERGRVQGYLSSIWGISAVIGPLLGAFLVQNVGWATVFWVNLPIGGAAAALLAATFRENHPAHPHRIDYLGSVLLIGGSGMFILALIQAQELGGAIVALLVVAALIFLFLLIRHERRIAEPMMPLDLWRHRIITAVNLGSLAIGAVMMATVVFLPTYVQGVMGRSALIAGFALTAMSLGWPLGSTVAGRLLARASYRQLAAVCGGALIAGSLLLAALDPARGPLWAGISAFLTGIGMGFGNTTFVIAAQASVGRSQRGIATSMTLFMRMLGQAVGAGLFGGILNIGLSRRLPGAGDVVERLMEPVQRLRLAPDALARLSGAVAQALHEVYLVAVVLAVVALGLAWLVPKRIGSWHARSD